MERLTKEQAIVISAYTGVLCCKFGDMHKAAEAKAGHPIWTHQFATGGGFDDKKMKKLFKEDFLSLCAEGSHE